LGVQPDARAGHHPRLHDAKVNGMAQLGMNINGVEDIDGVLYAQSWWCRTQG